MISSSDRTEADKLSVQVNEAVLLLNSYNERLSTEMDHRKKVSSMLKDFLDLQQELLAQAEHKLEVSYEVLIWKFYLNHKWRRVSIIVVITKCCMRKMNHLSIYFQLWFFTIDYSIKRTGK